MKEIKVAKEEAEEEFNEWCEANGVEYDDTQMDSSEQAQFKVFRHSVVRAVMNGSLVFDGPDAKYTISKLSPAGFAGNEITFHNSAMLYRESMKNHKDDWDRVVAIYAAATGKEIGFFSKISSADFKVVSAVSSLFLS